MNCPDCGVSPGEIHRDGCDVERCPGCGSQLISCCLGCGIDDATLEATRIPWSGEWPGVKECREFNLWCRWTSRGWVRCGKNHPDAREDLNRLSDVAFWSPNAKAFIRRSA